MSEQTLRTLNKILGKFERTMGVRIWGEIEGAPGTYAEILVKSDGTVKVEGVIYGSQGQQILQRATTYDLLVQLRNAGSEIDPRDVLDRATRLLGIIYGDQGQLAQRATTRDAYVQLRSGGVEIDPRDVLDRATRLLGVVYGSQAQQLLQRATTYDLLVQLRHAGTEIDPRLIQDVQKVVTPTYLTPTALGAGGTATIVPAPGSGYKLRLKGIQISVDAATRIDLRWATSAWRSYYLPANGTIERNFISENIEGGNNQALTLLSSAAATVTASATTESLAV